MTGARILVVEDEADLLAGLRDLLEAAGYAVTTALGAHAALAALARDVPDLIVSDIVMPEMDGFAFYEAVRALPDGSAIPFIFLSARSDRADVRAGKILGVDDYITKPFDPEDLFAAIASRLRRSSELGALRRRDFEALARQLSVTLSHELRTPVAEVSAYAQLLERGGTSLTAGEFEDLMHGLRVGVARLAHIVEDVELLVNLRSGRARALFEARRRRVEDVGSLLRAACEPFDRPARDREIALVVAAPDCLPAVDADATYLAAAIARVVDNAVKFSDRPGSTVRVSAGAAGDTVRIAVSDEGAGISPADLDALCGAFQQLDRATTEQQGLGIGLAVCSGLLDLHGGTLSVESRVGEGSTFTLAIPAVGGTARS